MQRQLSQSRSFLPELSRDVTAIIVGVATFLVLASVPARAQLRLEAGARPAGPGAGLVTDAPAEETNSTSDVWVDEPAATAPPTSVGMTAAPVHLCPALYNQLDDDSGDGYAAQDFEAAFDAFDCEGADDFVVPPGQTWLVDRAFFPIIAFDPGGLTGVNVAFYEDAGGVPGAPVPGGVFTGIVTFVAPPIGILVDLPTPVLLGPGHYWIAFQMEKDYDPFGQVWWSTRTTQANYAAVWRNPADGFGTGCTDWAPVIGCGGSYPDFRFRICGVVLPPCNRVHEQLDYASGDGTIAQDFQPVLDVFDCQAADDFVVPPGEAWVIHQLHAVTFNLGLAQSIHVAFLQDAGGSPGAPVPGAVFFDIAAFIEVPGWPGSLRVDLPAAVVLPPGHYWVAFQQREQWWWPLPGVFWASRSTQVHDEGVWRNPGGGYGTGCNNWSPKTTCTLDPGPDYLFALCGQVYAEPEAVCQPYAANGDANCCITLTVQDIDGGSYDPGGPADIASICITAVDGNPVGCVEHPDTVQICGFGDHLVTLTITDLAGHTDSCDATVSITDNTAPIITCPPDIEVFCVETIDPSVTGTATATDNCDPNPVITYLDDIVPGPCPWKGVVIRTWTATDASGNAASCPQTIQVMLLGLAGSHLSGSGTESGAILYDPTPGPGEKSQGGTGMLGDATARPFGTGPGRSGLRAPIPPRVSASEKGSVLIYPKVELRWNSDGDLIQDTFISLNNDYPEDIHVVMYFVVEGCLPSYRDTTLTANEATYWSAATGEPKMVGPFHEDVAPYPDPEGSGDDIVRGFIVVIATDENNQQIRWNHLYGAASIVHYFSAAWEYNAYAFQALDPVPNGGLVGTPGEIKLDGTDYAQCFETLLLDFFASNDLSDPAYPSAFGQGVTIDTDLTLVIADLDLTQGGSPFTTKADFWIWNQNETSRRTHHCFTCWDESLLSSLAGPFLIENLQTDKGRARIEGIENLECEDSTKRPLLGVAAKVLIFR